MFFRSVVALAVLLIGIASPLNAQAETVAWAVRKAASSIEFSGVHAGSAFTGRFENFDVAIAFDAQDLEASRIEARIDLSSARTGDRQRDSALPTADWFAVKQHPQAVFRSLQIEAVGPDKYRANGELTLRGVTRPIVLPFTLKIDGDKAIAEGETTLLRTDFGVGQGPEFSTGQWVALEVRVRIKISATRA